MCAMANYYNLLNVLYEHYPQIQGDQQLLSLHDELVVEIKKEENRFNSTHKSVPRGAFQWEKISSAVRVRFNALKGGVDEHYNASFMGCD